MSTWTTEQVDTIGAAQEIRLAPLRPDGTAHSAVTMWVVRVTDRLFIRSANGRSGSWFEQVLKTGQALLHAGGNEYAVEVTEPGHDLDPAIDGDYRSKYRGQTSAVNAMVAAGAQAATLELLPH
jgi:hypothetical protein